MISFFFSFFYFIGPFIISDLNEIACDVRKHNNKAIAKERRADVVGMLYLLRQKAGSSTLAGTFGPGINSKQVRRRSPLVSKPWMDKYRGGYVKTACECVLKGLSFPYPPFYPKFGFIMFFERPFF